ncbi:MAG: putative Ig domain-containing protein [Verrucomicrobiota bacterium]|jgi:hypothetical protein
MKLATLLFAIIAASLLPWGAVQAQCPGSMPTEPSNLRDLQTVVPTTGRFQGWSWTGGSGRGEVVLVEGLPTVTTVCEIQYINNGSHVRFDGQTFRVVKRLPQAVATEISYSNLDKCSPHALLLRNITAAAGDIPPFRVIRFRTGGCDGNGLPAIDPIGPIPPRREGEVFIVDLSASDRDVPFETLTYSIDNPQPGMSITPTGGDGTRRLARLTWATGEEHGPGNYPITVRVSDSYSSPTSATTTFVVTVQESNQPPEFNPIDPPVTATREEQTVQKLISAFDRDVPANPLTYSLDQAPSGMAIDPSSGMITWTPTEMQGPGDHQVIVRVSDQSADPTAPSLSATTSFWVSVQEANKAPYFQNPIIQPVVIHEERTLSLGIIARDNDMPPNPLTYSLDRAPSGMTIDPTSGMITWTPTEMQGPGDYPVIVKTSDQSADPTAPSLSATTSFWVSVQEANKAPYFPNPIIQPVVIHEELTLSLGIIARDDDMPPNPLIYSLDQAPSGMAIDPKSGVITWTPTELQGPKEHAVIVKVSDQSADPAAPSLSATNSFLVSVQEVNSPPRWDELPPQRLRELEPWQYRLTATDNDIPPNTLSYWPVKWLKSYWDPESKVIREISGSGLPEGMLLDVTTGLLSWTPASGQGAAKYTLTVKVQDASLDPLSPSLQDEGPLVLAVKSVRVVTLRISSLGPGKGQVELRFEALPGESYRLEAASEMQGPWALLQTIVTGPGGQIVAVEQAAEGTARFFRLVEP